MREWYLKLEKYGISKDEYLQMKHMCRNYDKMKRDLADCRSLKIRQPDGMPRGYDISDPTARAAEKSAKLSKNIKDIEQAAIEASPDLYPYLLKSVTKGVPFFQLEVPQGRNQFYETRRNFYIILGKRQGII